MHKKQKIIYWSIFGVLVALLAFLCFYRLGDSPIMDSDEGRHGVNAYEMMHTGNYIANFFYGEIDYWNLKPPISNYLIILGFKVFGFNAWGLRFFSTLLLFSVIIIVAIFLKIKFNDIASLIFILAFCGIFTGFIFTHFMRYADPDAAYLSFLTLGIITLYLSAENMNWLHLTGLSFALAFLSKSFHAFVILPVIAVYLLLTVRKDTKKLKWWQYLTVILTTVTPILIWAIARIHFDGFEFLRRMLEYDVLYRSNNAIEGHIIKRFFYLDFLSKYEFLIMASIFILLGTLLYRLIRRQKLTNFEKLTLVNTVTVFLIFGIAKTNLEWYIFPIYIPLLMFAAIQISKAPLKIPVLVIVSIVLLVFSSLNVCRVVTLPKEDELQTMITKKMPVDTQAEYYFEYEMRTILERSELLVFEWKTGGMLTSDKGLEGFHQSQQASYLIYDIKNHQPLNIYHTDIEVKCYSDNRKYVVYYHPARI